MYTIPISDSATYVVNDYDEDEWDVYHIDYEAQKIESFHVDGFGHISCAYYDELRKLIWTIIDGDIYAIKCDEKDVFEVPMPDESFFLYDILPTQNELFACGEYTNLWRCALPALEWEPIITPEPKPKRSEDPAIQTRQTTDYALKYPPLYKAFAKDGAAYFCGALGILVRYKNGKVERTEIDTGSRLVKGHAEGSLIALSSDTPSGGVFRGDFDQGFELIFTDDLRAMNLTAIHRGVRFIGVSEQPHSEVHCLYTFEDGELVRHETECSRDPFPLLAMVSTGNALWAADDTGVFRKAEDAWTLIELPQLQNGAWPLDK